MTGALSQTRCRRCISIPLLSLSLGLCGAAAWAQSAVPESYEVGQRWEYQHEGPRPGNIDPNVIDGQRIVQVISVSDGPQGKEWVLEERFTKSNDVTARLHVNPQQMLTMIEIENKKGEVARMRYDPRLPYRVLDLAVGATRKIDTTLKMDAVQFSLPSTITVERLADETITTPAGPFTGCQHLKTVTTSTVDIKIAKIPITEEREQWFHPRGHGLVKEVYRRGPVKFLTWSRPGYTATSVLTAFGRQDVPSAPGPAPQVRAQDPSARESSGPPAAHPSRRGPRLLLLGALGALAVGSFLRIRRARRR
jgi:hypothetical protein